MALVSHQPSLVSDHHPSATRLHPSALVSHEYVGHPREVASRRRHRDARRSLHLAQVSFVMRKIRTPVGKVPDTSGMHRVLP